MELLQYLIELFLHLDKHLNEIITQYQSWTYLILFGVIFAETGLVVTPFLPGDSLLFAAGTLAALADSPLNVHLLAALLMVAAIIGDTVNYAIGKYFGEKLLAHPKMKMIKPQHIKKTQQFYEKHGGKTIILARFIPIIRTFAPFVAGIGEMEYKRFISYNVIGGVVWVYLFVYAGYFFGNLEFVKNNFSLVIVAIIIISVIPVVIEFVKHRMESAKTKES